MKSEEGGKRTCGKGDGNQIGTRNMESQVGDGRNGGIMRRKLKKHIEGKTGGTVSDELDVKMDIQRQWDAHRGM